MSLKYSCPKTLEKNCGRPVFLEELQVTRNVSKVSLYFNKIPNSLRQVLQTYSEKHILQFTFGRNIHVTEKIPPEAVGKG